MACPPHLELGVHVPCALPPVPTPMNPDHIHYKGLWLLGLRLGGGRVTPLSLETLCGILWIMNIFIHYNW